MERVGGIWQAAGVMCRRDIGVIYDIDVECISEMFKCDAI